jgi:hypothetical protein
MPIQVEGETEICQPSEATQGKFHAIHQTSSSITISTGTNQFGGNQGLVILIQSLPLHFYNSILQQDLILQSLLFLFNKPIWWFNKLIWRHELILQPLLLFFNKPAIWRQDLIVQCTYHFFSTSQFGSSTSQFGIRK